MPEINLFRIILENIAAPPETKTLFLVTCAKENEKYSKKISQRH
jgi:hypothetical protein